jgi:hypothetical protein
MSEMNIETVEIEVSEAIETAVLLLARDYKKGSASDLALDLFTQVIKGRLKAKRAGAAVKIGEQYNNMLKSFAGNKDILDLLPSRQEYVNKELQKLDDAIFDLR